MQPKISQSKVLSSSSPNHRSYHDIPWISLCLPIFLIIVMSLFWILSFPNTSLDPKVRPLTVSLSFPSSVHSLPSSQSPIISKLPDDPLDLSSLLIRRLRTVQRIIRSGSDDQPPKDPLLLLPFWFTIPVHPDETDEPKSHDASDYLNVTLGQTLLRGLSSIRVKDVATNSVARSVSVLVRFDEITITGSYRVHQDHLGHNEKDKIKFNDAGKYRFKISDLHSSWFARVARLDIVSDQITTYQPFLKSFIESDSKYEFSSSVHHFCDRICNKTLAMIGPTIVDKIKAQVDSQLLETISSVIKEEPIANVSQWLDADFGSLYNYNYASTRQRRQVPCKPGKELDEYVDSLFRFAARIVKVMEPFELPNATVYLPEYSLKVFLYEGGATRAFTLNRKKSAWVHCSNESVSLGLTVGFENFRVKYKYRAIHDWKLLWDGDLEADLQDTKVQVQFTQTTPRPGDEGENEKVQQRVDRLRIWRLGKVRIIIRGLGNLTQGAALWLSQLLNDPKNQKQLEPSLRRLEIEAVSMINVMLQNITVPFFTII